MASIPLSRIISEGRRELLPGEKHISADHHNIQLTNYRLFWKEDGLKFCVLLGLIENVEYGVHRMKIHCKNGATLRLPIRGNYLAREILQQANKVAAPQTLFAKLFYHGSLKRANAEPHWKLVHEALAKRNPTSPMIWEFERQGFSNDWRISDVNESFSVCPTYPQHLIVPANVTDAKLKQAAAYRIKGRLPVLTWRHANGAVLLRSSQPAIGFKCCKVTADKEYLDAIIKVVSDSQARATQDLLIMDVRGFLTALAYRARGGGWEMTKVYNNTTLKHVDLPNMYKVRKSFQSLRKLCTRNIHHKGWFSGLEKTGWLNNISLLLKTAYDISVDVEQKRRSVLVHCSDGWDRSTQIISLVQLILDPYYRTFEGFQCLVEKEWLHFGHSFANRSGQGYMEKPDATSPLFVQWLDCVFQLHTQNPTHFEFTTSYLVRLLIHTYSGLFGTFLTNSLKANLVLNLPDDTFSVWSFLELHRELFINFLYEENPKEPLISPSFWAWELSFWVEAYMNEPIFVATNENHFWTPQNVNSARINNQNRQDKSEGTSKSNDGKSSNSESCADDFPDNIAKKGSDQEAKDDQSDEFWLVLQDSEQDVVSQMETRDQSVPCVSNGGNRKLLPVLPRISETEETAINPESEDTDQTVRISEETSTCTTLIASPDTGKSKTVTTYEKSGTASVFRNVTNQIVKTTSKNVNQLLTTIDRIEDSVDQTKKAISSSRERIISDAGNTVTMLDEMADKQQDSSGLLAQMSQQLKKQAEREVEELSKLEDNVETFKEETVAELSVVTERIVDTADHTMCLLAVPEYPENVINTSIALDSTIEPGDRSIMESIASPENRVDSQKKLLSEAEELASLLVAAQEKVFLENTRRLAHRSSAEEVDEAESQMGREMAKFIDSNPSFLKLLEKFDDQELQPEQLDVAQQVNRVLAFLSSDAYKNAATSRNHGDYSATKSSEQEISQRKPNTSHQNPSGDLNGEKACVLHFSELDPMPSTSKGHKAPIYGQVFGETTENDSYNESTRPNTTLGIPDSEMVKEPKPIILRPSKSLPLFVANGKSVEGCRWPSTATPSKETNGSEAPTSEETWSHFSLSDNGYHQYLQLMDGLPIVYKDSYLKMGKLMTELNHLRQFKMTVTDEQN